MKRPQLLRQIDMSEMCEGQKRRSVIQKGAAERTVIRDVVPSTKLPLKCLPNNVSPLMLFRALWFKDSHLHLDQYKYDISCIKRSFTGLPTQTEEVSRRAATAPNTYKHLYTYCTNFHLSIYFVDRLIFILSQNVIDRPYRN